MKRFIGASIIASVFIILFILTVVSTGSAIGAILIWSTAIIATCAIVCGVNMLFDD